MWLCNVLINENYLYIQCQQTNKLHSTICRCTVCNIFPSEKCCNKSINEIDKVTDEHVLGSTAIEAQNSNSASMNCIHVTHQC